MDDEHLITLAQAARERNVHVSTLHRARLKGVRGVRLETVMRGGRRMTSREACRRFDSRITAVSDGAAPPVCIDRQREREIAAAEAELASILGTSQ